MPRLFALGLLSLLASTGAAVANPSLTILYSFCSRGGSSCADGLQPTANLLVEETSLPGGPVIYGSAARGGANQQGVVFQLVPNIGSSYSEYVLYDFCSAAGCADGASPSSLAVGSDGNFYGAAFGGGAGPNPSGILFELVPGDPRYIETVLYDFCALADCADGANPSSLLSGASGQLFGTAGSGDIGHPEHGKVFKWSASGGEKVLYTFCQQTNCVDGSEINGGLLKDGSGDLFGTTPGGGVKGQGIVFELTSGLGETVLYSFCSKKKCKDGALPGNGRLAHGGNGTLFGTTSAGGAFGQGVVYRLNGNGGEKVLYSFCPAGESAGCPDGAQPGGNLLRDKSGNLYGTAGGGGSGAGGTIFELLRSEVSGKVTYTEQVLWTFPGSSSNCPDGCAPTALAFDSAGNLYGIAPVGGANGGGTVFELTP